MARDRQRAKQRQAERRARRLAAAGRAAEPVASDEARTPEPGPAGPGDVQQSDFLGVPGVTPGLSTGAPPENEGRSDTVFEHETTEEEALQEIEDWEVGGEDT